MFPAADCVGELRYRTSQGAQGLDSLAGLVPGALIMQVQRLTLMPGVMTSIHKTGDSMCLVCSCPFAGAISPRRETF